MKLLFCDYCGDIFNLALRRVKSCSCGRTKGWYIDNSRAEVNGHGYSLAMGTGSLHMAVAAVNGMKEDWRKPDDDVWRRHPTTIIAWARPHTGPANSHTKIVPDLK